jgi:hypothetical protein
MQPIKLGKFLVGTAFGQVVVEKDGQGQPMQFSPGEIEQAKELIGTALSMESFEILPEHIDFNHFQVLFHEDNTLTLSSLSREGEIPFSWREGDELIVRLQEGLDMVMNERQVNAGNVKPITAAVDNGEPFL